MCRILSIKKKYKCMHVVINICMHYYEIGSNMNIIEGYKSSTRFFALCRSAVTFSSLEKEYVSIIYSLTTFNVHQR